MKEKGNKRYKKENWMKVLLGFFLLSWKLINRKSSINEKRKSQKDEQAIQERIITLINTNKAMEKNTDEKRKDWLKAQPEELPSPTYWPFFLAMGLTFLFWGILTSWIIVLVGLFIFIISLAGWINILRHE